MARKKTSRNRNELHARDIPEREVVKAVLNVLALNRNIRVWRRNTGALPADNGKRFIRFGVPGMSDIFGIIQTMRCPVCGRLTGRGVHLEIECKRYGGRLSQAQKDFLATIKKYGGKTLVAIPNPTDEDPTGFRAIYEVIARLDKETCVECSKR